MRKFFIGLVVLALFIGIYFYVKSKSSSVPVDQLSHEQLQVLDNAPNDIYTKEEDLLFPDGTNMKKWREENDPNWEPIFD